MFIVSFVFVFILFIVSFAFAFVYCFVIVGNHFYSQLAVRGS